MCTVSYLPTGPDAYLLASNRDELKSRKKASAPEVHTVDGIRCLWPVDGEAGGTWIAVNESGCSFTLMNDFQNQMPEKAEQQKQENEVEQSGKRNMNGKPGAAKYQSRGFIIPNIAGCTYVREVSEKLNKLLEKPFQPFRLLLANIHEGVTMWHFNGQTLQDIRQGKGAGLWVSAGKNEEQVRSRRRKVFEMYLKKDYSDHLQRIRNLHTSRLPEPGPLAISMELDKVQTVSSTILEVRLADSIHMHCMQGFPSPEKKWQRYTL